MTEQNALLSYKDHTIEFDVKSEKWKCKEFGLVTHDLALLKQKIDQISADSRRLNIKALHVNVPYGGEPTLETVTITILDADRNEAWVMRPNNNKREKVGLNTLYALVAKDALESVMLEQRQAQAKLKALGVERARIPHYTRESLLAAKPKVTT